MKLKYRLDQLLVLKGLSENASKARSLIMSGKVYVSDKKIDKSGHKFYITDKIHIKQNLHPWVSRGGSKIQKAIDEFNINPRGMVCADVGSSTGGFTDVLLNLNIKKIYSIDVGSGQLAWKIRNDERVIVLEKTNVRYITKNEIKTLLDLIVCDVSFISITKALENIMLLTKKGSFLVALIKPQFEVGKNKIGKGGIVREDSYRKEAIEKVILWLENIKNWKVQGICESPIRGAKGNIEYLVHAIRL